MTLGVNINPVADGPEERCPYCTSDKLGYRTQDAKLFSIDEKHGGYHFYRTCKKCKAEYELVFRLLFVNRVSTRVLEMSEGGE